MCTGINMFFIPKRFHNLSACLLDFTLIWVLTALFCIFYNLKLKNLIACFALYLGCFFCKKLIFTKMANISDSNNLSPKVENLITFYLNIQINNCVINPIFAGDLIQRQVWSWPLRFQGYRKWGRCRWMGRMWWSST